MLTLYHAPRARSTRTRWLLEELGVPYELKKLKFTAEDMQSAEYLAVHPMGKVPSLVEDGKVLFESGALCEYLTEKYAGQTPLHVPPGDERRGEYLQWIHFAEATAMGPAADMFQHQMLRPKEKRIPAVAAEAREKFEKVLGVLEQTLEGRDYILGKEFTAADTMVGYVVSSAGFLGMLTEKRPGLKAYLGRLIARPAFQRASAP